MWWMEQCTLLSCKEYSGQIEKKVKKSEENEEKSNAVKLFIIIKLPKHLILEQHVYCILIYYRGHHRKGVAILDAT